MKFSVVSLFPELVTEALKVGVVGQAILQNKIEIEVINPRNWTHDVHKTVDDRPFGGGDGMVLMPEPLSLCLTETLNKNSSSEVTKPRMVYLSPQGKTLNHHRVMELAKESHILMLCGRYAGVDQRLLNHFNFEEISVGDFVLSGGELAALILIDAVGRQLDGVLGHKESSLIDSFAGDGLLEGPCFTRPREWQNQSVPSFLLTGNHAQISWDRWLVSLLITFVKRKDLYDDYIKIHKLKLTKDLQKISGKLKAITNNELTTLGLTRKNLEEFEVSLRHQ